MANYAKKNNEALTVEILDEIAILSETEKAKKMLAFVKWGDNTPKLEVRNWYKKVDGTTKANSGATLTVEECMALRDALNSVDFTKYAPTAPTEKGKAANKGKEPTATKKPRTRKSTTTAKKTTANKEKEPVAMAKEPTDALADALNNMSAADLLKILVK